MDAHTPGPWHVTGCLDLWVEPVGAPDDGAFHGIAHCGDIHWPDYEAKQKEWEANARLIASAPTLAAELAKLREDYRECVDALEKSHEWCPLCSGAGSYAVGKHVGNPHQEECEACADIRAALALAKGRAG